MTSLLLLCLLVSSCLVYTVIGAPCGTCEDCVADFKDEVESTNCIAFFEQLKYGLEQNAETKCPDETVISTKGCVVGLTTARENLALQCTGPSLVQALPASILLAEIEDLKTAAFTAENPCVVVDALILMLHGGNQACYNAGTTFTGSNSGKKAADLKTACTVSSCTSEVLEPVTTLGLIWNDSWFDDKVVSDAQLPPEDPNPVRRRLASSGRRLQNDSACQIFVTAAEEHQIQPNTDSCPTFAQALACAQDVDAALDAATTKCGSHYDDTIKLQFQLQELTKAVTEDNVACEGIDAILDLTYNSGTLYGVCATEIVKQDDDYCAAVDSIKTICIIEEQSIPEEGTVQLAIENAIYNRGGEFESVRTMCESVLEALEGEDCPLVDADYKNCIVEAATVRGKLEYCDAQNAQDEFLHFSQYAAYVESLLGDVTPDCPSGDALVNILKGGTAACYTAAKSFTTVSNSVVSLKNCAPSVACVAALEPLESIFEMWKATIGGVATFPFSDDAIALLAPSSRRLAGTTDTACDTFAAAGVAYFDTENSPDTCPTLVDALACTSLITAQDVETECGKRYHHESVFQYLLDDLLDTIAPSEGDKEPIECPGLKAIVDLNHVDSNLNEACVTALLGLNSAYTTDEACIQIQGFEENAFGCPTESQYEDCNAVIASSFEAIEDACPEGGTFELFDDVNYTISYQTIIESCSMFISSLKASNAQCPKVISKDIEKCIVDAASVRQKVGKQCDSLDLLEISGLAWQVESLGEAIDGGCNIVDALVNILKGGKPECYEAAIAFTTTQTVGNLTDCTPSQACTDALEPFDIILAMWGTNLNSQISEYFNSPARRLLTLDERVLIEDGSNDDDDSADDEDVGPCDAFVEAGQAYLAGNDASCPSLYDALSCTFELQQAGDKVVAECGENYHHTIILQYYLDDLNTEIAAESSNECNGLTAIVELNLEDSSLTSACSVALAGWDYLDQLDDLDDPEKACKIVWQFEQGGTECPTKADYTVCKDAMDAMVSAIEDGCSASVNDTIVVETLNIVEEATFVYDEAEVEQCEAETEASTESGAPVNMMYSTFALVIALLLHIVF